MFQKCEHVGHATDLLPKQKEKKGKIVGLHNQSVTIDVAFGMSPVF